MKQLKKGRQYNEISSRSMTLNEIIKRNPVANNVTLFRMQKNLKNMYVLIASGAHSKTKTGIKIYLRTFQMTYIIIK